MTIPPIPCRWDGEAFAPLGGFAKVADEHFVIGQVYVMAEADERSDKSHRHYFACIREAWSNLRGSDVLLHPTPEHLRKWALITAGYHDAQVTVCMFKTEAERVAAFVRPQDRFAVTLVNDKVVTVYRARSQSLKAMGKQDFQDSKDKVLGICADLIGVTVEELTKSSQGAGGANNPVREAA